MTFFAFNNRSRLPTVVFCGIHDPTFVLTAVPQQMIASRARQNSRQPTASPRDHIWQAFPFLYSIFRKHTVHTLRNALIGPLLRDP